MAVEPYWGPIDAMHQFCEAKYATSPYAAEFWNSLSNIPFFIVPGIYGLNRVYGAHDWRLTLQWLTMILVGVGSLIFHGTMRFKLEMLDEVPMLMLVLSGIWSKDDTHWITRGMWKNMFHSVALGITLVGLYMYISRGAYEIFVHTFTLVVLLDLALAIVCMSKPDHHGSSVCKLCLLISGVTLGLGRVAWETEAHLCVSGAGGILAVLHVLFHLLAGFSCYFGLMADVHNRYDVLGVGAAVDAPGARWPLIGMVGGSWLRPAAESCQELAAESCS